MVKQYRVLSDGQYLCDLPVDEIQPRKTGLLISALSKDSIAGAYIKLGVTSVVLDVCNHHPKFTVHCGYDRRIVINVASCTLRTYPNNKIHPLPSDVWRCARIHWEAFKDKFPNIRHFPAERLWCLKGQETEDGVVDYGYTAEIDE